METFNSPVEAAQKILEAIQKEYKEMEKLNLMVLGKTGVGKSTLINNIFGKDIAEAGIGKPITPKIKMHSLPDYPLAIYDTPGLELSGDNDVEELLSQVTGVIQSGYKSNEISEMIHCILYCVSVPSHRFEEAEANFLKELTIKIRAYSIPVIVVLTQAYATRDVKELKATIENENLEIENIVAVLAEDFYLDEEDEVPARKAYGLDKLCEVINYVVPDAVRKTFIALQIKNLELKKGKAQAVVAASAATAAAIGAVPIPFSDAFLLVPEQTAMLAGITVAFGVPVEKATFAAIISATIGTAGTTVLGKTVVSGLLKLIPGAGSVVGGTISAATAAALTVSLGEAYILIMTQVCKGEMNLADIATDAGRREVTRIFKDRLKVKRDNSGQPVSIQEEAEVPVG